MDPDQILALNTLITGAGIAIWDQVSRRRKERQEAKIDQYAAVAKIQNQLNESMLSQIAELREELRVAREQEESLREEVAELRGMIKMYERCTADDCPFQHSRRLPP